MLIMFATGVIAGILAVLCVETLVEWIA